MLSTVIALASVATPVLAAEVNAAAENKFTHRHSPAADNQFRAGQPHVAALGGFADVPRDNTGGLVGVDIGYEPLSPISVGANFSLAGPGADDTRMMLMGYADYNFGGDLPILRYSYLGVEAGWIRDTAQVTNDIELSDNYMGIGPRIGFDQPVAAFWTVGATARYLFNVEDSDSHTFALAGVVKYWL